MNDYYGYNLKDFACNLKDLNCNLKDLNCNLKDLNCNLKDFARYADMMSRAVWAILGEEASVPDVIDCGDFTLRVVPSW